MKSVKNDVPSSPRWALPGSVVMKAGGGAALVAGRCSACGKAMFPKAAVCPQCMGEAIGSLELSREGKLYSFALLHRARKGWQAPYAIGYVDLPEGVRVIAPLELSGAFQPRCDGTVRLMVGRLRVDDDGTEYLSHRFVPID